MSLKKFTAELLLTKGIEQKVPEEVIPDESLTTALNVDFSKVGAARKRRGFVSNSNLALGAGVMDEVRRLGTRRGGEALCVTETVTQLGSSAGVGNAGDTVYSYSEQTSRWVPRGKMPRPCVDRLWGTGIQANLTPAASDPYVSFVTGGIQNLVCLAYRCVSQTTGFYLRVVVLDVGGDVSAPIREGGTVVIDTAISTSGYPVGWVTSGDKVWLFVASYGAAPPVTHAYAFRFADLTFDSSPTVLAVGKDCLAVSGDGTSIIVAMTYANQFELNRYDGDLVVQATTAGLGAALTSSEVAIDARSGTRVDVARHNRTAGETYVSSYNFTTLAAVLSTTLVAGGEPSATTGAARGNIQICTVNETDAVVLVAHQSTNTVTNLPTYLSVLKVNMTTGSGYGELLHQGLVPYSQPFIFDGRVFAILMRTTGYVQNVIGNFFGSESSEEAFLCVQIPLDNLNQNSVPFPCAQWRYGLSITKARGGDNSSYWMCGRTVYQYEGGLYVLCPVSVESTSKTSTPEVTPELVRLEFGDAAHRWRTDEFSDYAVFAGGILTSYDGDKAHEATAGLGAPAFCDYGLGAGGTLTSGVEYFFQSAMLYTDAGGRQCWGPPSRIVSLTPTPGNQSIYAVYSPPPLSMRPDMGNQFSGRGKLFFFLWNANDTTKLAVDSREVNPLERSAITLFATAPVTAASQMYTSGFELENWPAPPCRALTAHNGRLFVIGDDDNQIWYTKPDRANRGPEFALAQTIPLAERGTALASMGDRLVVFTTKAIYAIQGDGPDVTGTPPDAFSRPLLISPDYACSEYCAAGRTPLGVIFRGEQGFYLLTQGFGVEYIGGSVEDITSTWEATRAIVHDQELGCCRVLGWNGSESQELCFWYDTKRWSLSTLATETTTRDGLEAHFSVIDARAMGGNLMEATTDTTVGIISRYRLGTRTTTPYFRDYDNDYDQVVETGWITFNHIATLKRFYRALVFFRPLSSDCTVYVQVFKDWEETPSSEREFVVSSTETEARTLRVHLKEQKIKAVRIRVTVSSSGQGIELLKLGLEMGMKQMASKEKREWSA